MPAHHPLTSADDIPAAAASALWTSYGVFSNPELLPVAHALAKTEQRDQLLLLQPDFSRALRLQHVCQDIVALELLSGINPS